MSGFILAIWRQKPVWCTGMNIDNKLLHTVWLNYGTLCIRRYPFIFYFSNCHFWTLVVPSSTESILFNSFHSNEENELDLIQSAFLLRVRYRYWERILLRVLNCISKSGLLNLLTNQHERTQVISGFFFRIRIYRIWVPSFFVWSSAL